MRERCERQSHLDANQNKAGSNLSPVKIKFNKLMGISRTHRSDNGIANGSSASSAHNSKRRNKKQSERYVNDCADSSRREGLFAFFGNDIRCSKKAAIQEKRFASDNIATGCHEPSYDELMRNV